MSNTKQQWVNTIIISADWLGQSNVFKEFEILITIQNYYYYFTYTALWEESHSQKKNRLLSKELQSD